LPWETPEDPDFSAGEMRGRAQPRSRPGSFMGELRLADFTRATLADRLPASTAFGGKRSPPAAASGCKRCSACTACTPCGHRLQQPITACSACGDRLLQAMTACTACSQRFKIFAINKSFGEYTSNLRNSPEWLIHADSPVSPWSHYCWRLQAVTACDRLRLQCKRSPLAVQACARRQEVCKRCKRRKRSPLALKALQAVAASVLQPFYA
jgi:hypothetical protein